DDGFTVDLLDGASDPDTSDELNIDNLTLTEGNDAGVTINGNSLQIDPRAYNALAVGESEVITYSYDVVDGNEGSVSQTAMITITGKNDGPSVAAAIVIVVSEDAIAFTLDLLDGASDPDSTDVISVDGLTLMAGDSSGVTINGNDLEIDPNAYEALGIGESEVITYSYNVIDGNGGSEAQTASITITGKNDDPEIATALEVAGTEDDESFTVDLLDGASDPDSSDTLAIDGLTLSSGDDSGVSIDGTNLEIDPSVYNYLSVGESEVITYSYDIIDGNGGSVSQTASVTISGENDEPAAADIIVYTNNISNPTAGADVPLFGDGRLVDGLGGEAGFGEQSVDRNDDGNSGQIDLSAVFESGLNFFGTTYTGLYINTNGNVSFGSSVSQYTPSQIGAGISFPIIAPLWSDVDTRGGTASATPGGNSTGENLIWYDLDAVNGVFTVTWDDVGYFSRAAEPVNAYQLQLFDRGGGDFDIVFRYEDINWTSGDASGGEDGLGGTAARAGFSAGNGEDFAELAQSGNENAILDLENATGNLDTGVFSFDVRDGEVDIYPFTITEEQLLRYVDDPDQSDVLDITEITDTTGLTAVWTANEVVSVAIEADASGSFNYTVVDGRTGIDQGTVSVVTVDGNDIFGSSAGDILIGGVNADRLRGDAGHDSLTGGGGADTFYYELPSDGGYVASNVAVSASGIAGDTVEDFSQDQNDIFAFNAANFDLELVTADNFSLIFDEYDGTNGTSLDWLSETPSGSLILDSQNNLIYDDNGIGAGYTIIARLENGVTLGTDDLQAVA
ncbi:MAG: cadherin-like domain-containing protein, partial [Rhodospirillaceae bacterium]|nr:cadherin-like domain-containing protein [Rhodospirillaceae bacterium]